MSQPPIDAYFPGAPGAPAPAPARTPAPAPAGASAPAPEGASAPAAPGGPAGSSLPPGFPGAGTAGGPLELVLEALESVPDPLYLIDREYRFLYVNEAAATAWGRPRESLVGSVIWQALPGTLESEAGRKLVTAMREGRAARYEVVSPMMRRWIEVSVAPIRDGLMVRFHDIADRKQVEGALRRSQAVLAQAGRMAGMGAWDIEIADPANPHASPLRWSDEVFRIFGYPPGGVQVTNQLFFERVHPEDRRRVAEAIAQAIEWHEPYSIEHRIVRPDGVERRVREHAEIFYDDEGQPRQIVGAVLDITDARTIEDELRDSRDTLALAVETTGLGLFDYDLRSGGLRWSDTAKRHFGLPPRVEVTYETFLRGLHPEDRERVQETIARALEPDSGGLYHTEYRTIGLADGIERWLEARGHVTFGLDGRATRLIGATVEITARKRAERELRETTERLALTLAAARVGTFDYRPLTGDMFWDEQTRAMWGLRPDEPMPDWATMLARVHPEDRARVEAVTTRALAPGQGGGFEIEYRVVWPDGSVHWMATKGHVEFEGEGPRRRPARIMGVHIDVTQRRRSEEERERLLAEHRRQREFLDAIMDVNPTMIFIRDRAGRYLFANRAYAELLGTTAEELIGRTPTEVGIPAPQADEMARTDREVLATGGEVRIPELVLQDAAGRAHVLQVIKRPIAGPRGGTTTVLAAATDITEHKELEARLSQMQKSEAIGVLAGGVAHDFNNLLLVIMGNTELALGGVERGSEVRDLLERVLQAANHGAALTRQLLAYVGKGRPQKEPVDLTEVVRQGMGLFESSIPSRIRFYVDLAPDLRLMRADRTQLQQVLTNLALNAAEAIGERAGSISIRTFMRRVRHPVSTAFPGDLLAPGRYVTLEVTDDGAGMDEAVRRRIFDPFFTTKFVGRGLGLAAVSGIVRSHQGAILLESAPGRGTRFTVLFPALPAARRRSQAAPAEGGGGGRGPRRGGRSGRAVLVVDDQDVVREMAALALRRRGYEPLLAASGPQAIDIYRRDAGRIAVVLLDLGMPGMGGEQVLDELLALDPEVKVIISSGYAEEDAMHALHGLPVAGILQKPYTPRLLAEAVAAAVGDGPTAADPMQDVAAAAPLRPGGPAPPAGPSAHRGPPA